MTRYLETDTSSALERARLFRLAWDTCCSAFGSWQVSYERFFGGNTIRNRVALHGQSYREAMTAMVREFLDQE